MYKSVTLLLFFLLYISLGHAQSGFIIGQDLSYVNQMEDCGAVYREDGEIKDVYQIFADNGTNLIRIRLWHNPSWQESLKQPDGVKSQYSNFEDVKESIFRAKMAGMKVMLGFHLSDFWCDPGRQIIPKAWEGVANNEATLQDSIYSYVSKILSDLTAEDLMPEYVKVGNENNSGIMTHKGMNSSYEGITLISNSWARHAKMYNAAIKAVRDVSANTSIKPKIALHVADPKNAEWFYNNIISNGVTNFDIMGFTYYYSYHKQSPAQVGQIISKIKTQHPNYDAMIVETGYLWDTQNIDGLGNIITESSPSYQPVSPDMQKKFMVDLSNEVKNAGGLGVIFWESAWVSTPCTTPWGKGSSQEHVAFFDHRNNLNYMKNGGGGWPNEFWGENEKTTSKVTFKVDMTNGEIARGVYIVGTMTNWEFVTMQPETSNPKIYTASLDLNKGDAHAFYFITTNTWDNYENYRETVPEECATSDEVLNDADWNTDRGFVVSQNDTIIAYEWSSCETFITGIDQPINFSQYLKVFPNPSNNQKINIQVKNLNQDFSLRIFNAMGQQQFIDFYFDENNEIYEVNSLRKGIYLITLTVNQQTFTQKILVQ